MRLPIPDIALDVLDRPIQRAQAATPDWLGRLSARVMQDPRAFWLELGAALGTGLIIFLILWWLVSRWTRGIRRRIERRELWDEERKAAEKARIGSLGVYLRNLALLLGALVSLGLVALDYGIPVLEDMALAVRAWLMTGGIVHLIRIALVAVGLSVLLTLVRKLAVALTPTSGERFERDVARAATIRTVFESTLQVALMTLFVIYVLSELGAQVGTLLAGVGILGLAISFGAQSLVKDLISGFFILFENQYGVGDVVKIGELSGGVESINLRITTLRDLEGRVHIIPNGTIDKVTVLSKEWSRSVIDIEVAYRTDLDRALEVLQDEAMKLYEDPEWQWRISQPPETLGVEAFGASGIRLRIMFETLPKEQWGVGREFRKRIKARFDSEDIEIPFPHVTVYWGEGQTPQREETTAERAVETKG